MSDIVEEQLSAFLDDALPESEEELLLRRLERSNTHRDRLMRYGLIGDLLRGDPTAGALMDVSGTVHQVLAKDGDVVPARAGRSKLKIGGWAAAIAASIAAVVAINLDLTGQNSPISESVDAQIALTSEARRMNYDEFSALDDSPRSRLAPARLTSYLVSHGDYTRGLSRQMMNSHVVNRRPELMRASFAQDQ